MKCARPGSACSGPARRGGGGGRPAAPRIAALRSLAPFRAGCSCGLVVPSLSLPFPLVPCVFLPTAVPSRWAPPPPGPRDELFVKKARGVWEVMRTKGGAGRAGRAPHPILFFVSYPRIGIVCLAGPWLGPYISLLYQSTAVGAPPRSAPPASSGHPLSPLRTRLRSEISFLPERRFTTPKVTSPLDKRAAGHQS